MIAATCDSSVRRNQRDASTAKLESSKTRDASHETREKRARVANRAEGIREADGIREGFSLLGLVFIRSHYGSKQGNIETLDYTLSHELGSERSERASERMSAAERASEASRAEQANE